MSVPNHRLSLFKFLRAVAASGLPSGQRQFLITSLTWADFETREFYPSIPTIADAMGVTEPTVRKYLREVEAAGFIQLKRTNGGKGRTHLFLLRDDKLIAWVEHRNAIKPEKGLRVAVTTNSESAPRRGLAGPNTKEDCGEPSIQPAKNTPMSEPVISVAASQRWMDVSEPAKSKLALLHQSGVQGENLFALAQSSLTLDEIRSSIDAVRESSGVRDVAAVLVRRLSNQIGMDLRRGRLLTREETNAVGRIEKRQRGLHSHRQANLEVPACMGLHSRAH